MAQVISVMVYRMGHGNVLDVGQTRGIPMPAEFIPITSAQQPEEPAYHPKKYVYSKIIYSRGGGLFETVYSSETVAALIVKANT